MARRDGEWQASATKERGPFSATLATLSARAPGISLAVHPDNPRAKGLYEHLGFEHVGSQEGHFMMLKRF